MSRTEVAPIKAAFETHKLYGSSHVGAVRSENQDFIGFARQDERTLLIVVDGMGGHSGGYEASRIATKEMKIFFEESDLPPLELLQQSIAIAHQKILEFAANDPSFEGMGTTVVCALIESDRAWLAHVGDSRAHLLRDRVLYQLTIDHTCINNIALCGEIAYDQLENHKLGHILDRSLGSEDPPEIEIQVSPIHLTPGDRLILSTDGFWQYCSDQDIRELLQDDPLETAIQDGIAHALNKGGRDNITIAILECLHSNFDKEPILDARTEFKSRVSKAFSAKQIQVAAERKVTNSHGLREEYMEDASIPLPPPPEPAPIVPIVLGIVATFTIIVLVVVFAL
ncbi:MAG: protein phosphatase 2C domain-containing protein [Myxococcota bacterium]|nr:protein phosphatase 2C domain-containing protein [Myxococcota bacterium]